MPGALAGAAAGVPQRRDQPDVGERADRAPLHLVELDDQAGLRIPAGIVGCPPESVEIGMPVTVAFEEVAGTHEDKDRVYVPVFAPSTPGGH